MTAFLVNKPRSASAGGHAPKGGKREVIRLLPAATKGLGLALHGEDEVAGTGKRAVRCGAERIGRLRVDHAEWQC